jgi:hypothetical protein
MLTYAVSFSDFLLVKLNIHNQCLNVDLVSPTYTANSGSGCYRAPDYRVSAGDIMRSGFILKSGGASYGVLIYRLRMRHLHESTEIGKGASSAIHLLVVWETSRSNELYVDVLLVEHNKGFDWDKDNLRELHHKNINQFRLCSVPVIETWSSYDNTRLMTTFKIINEDHMLNITISEVEKDNGARTLARIEPER